MRSRWNPLGLINDIPLKMKFLFIYVFCVLIPILTINALFYVRISANAEAQQNKNLQISVDRAGYEMQQMINECVAIGNTVAADRVINELLDRNYADYGDYYDSYNDVLRDKLRQYTNLHSYISWLGVYTSNPTIQNGGSYFSIRPADRTSDWYRNINSTKEKVLLVSFLDTNPMNPQQNMIYVSIIRRLDNYPDLLKHSKYLRIDLRLEHWLELFSNERDYLRFQLVDEQNRVVLETGHSYFGTGKQLEGLSPDEEQGQEAPNRFVSTLNTASYTSGWRLIGTPNRGLADRQMHVTSRFFLELSLITIVVPTVLILVIFSSYNRRVSLLYKHMKLVKYERFEPIAIYGGKDEIGGLLSSFNLMTEKIRNLINDVYKLEIQKKDLELEQVRAELNFLQSQVDPHFLFNTLNAILVVCKKYQYDQVTDIIRNLSQILRRLLSWKNDWVTVKEELDFIDMYLQIEKFRFQDRFTYELDVDPAAHDCEIPKMSIQSLVENSCKHGLQSVKGLRRIRVGVRLGEELIIEVEDNGIGMDEDKLNEIVRNLDSESPSGKNIGLRNVYKRLNLYYAGRAQFSIESIPGERTAIRIGIPREFLNCLTLEQPHD